MPALSRSLLGDLLILLAALIWGVAFYFQKTAMSHIGPFLFVGLRGCVAALALLPFALIEQRRSGTGRNRSGTSPAGTASANSKSGFGQITPIACMGGLVFFIAGSIQQMGIVTATVTNTGFLTAIYVVVTPFLFWILKRKSPSRLIWVSACLAMVGVWALGGASLTDFSRGDLLVAASSVFWAVLIIVSGEAARYEQPLSYTCIQFLVVGLSGLLAAALFEVIDWQAIVKAAESILYVGLLSTALTFGIMAFALQYVPAPRASILLSLETLFAAMAGYALLGERLELMGWTGAGLILSAVVMLQIRRGADTEFPESKP